MNLRFSDYIVYVDESGDHGLKTIDPNYPIFVLAFCIFKKTDYWQQTVPSLQAFKFKHFGHDQVILHETDIRKDRGNFSCLNTKEIKDNFLSELTHIIEGSMFTLVATVIKKEEHRKRYYEPSNPYHIAQGLVWSACLISCTANKQNRTPLISSLKNAEKQRMTNWSWSFGVSVRAAITTVIYTLLN